MSTKSTEPLTFHVQGYSKQSLKKPPGLRKSHLTPLSAAYNIPDTRHMIRCIRIGVSRPQVEGRNLPTSSGRGKVGANARSECEMRTRRSGKCIHYGNRFRCDGPANCRSSSDMSFHFPLTWKRITQFKEEVYIKLCSQQITLTSYSYNCILSG